MPDDTSLLRRYVDDGAQDAFAELVRRHIGFVYGIALRQLRGNSALAGDVTQMVFIDLARKAARVARHPALVAWLHTATRFAVRSSLRSESRRKAHERDERVVEALIPPDQAATDSAAWQPVLDEVLGELKERERTALLLRYFEGLRLAEVGARLALSETAARSCVDRALERMRIRLARRGLTSTSTALGIALASQAGAAAPAGLAAVVTGAALAQVGGTSGALVVFMGLTKTQIGIVAVVVLVAAMISVDQSRTNAALTREIGELRAETQQLALLRAENLRLTQTVAQLSRKPEPAPSTPAAVAPVAIAEPTVVVSGPRVALKQGSDSPYLARVKEFDQIAQRQVAVMNQEGKQLAEEHKVLLARSSDPSLTPEARAQAAADAALKMEMIRSRQREIQAFIEGTRNLMNEQLTLARTADEHAPLPEPPIVIRLLGSTPENALATYEKISGASIVRDPSLASLRGVIDVPAWFCAKPDALESLRLALRNQLNIELETTANGTLVARLGVPR